MQKTLTESQNNRLIDTNSSGPYSFEEFDFEKPFVYTRSFGLFFVPFGYHPHTLSLFLAFENGFSDGYSMANSLNLRYGYPTAEFYLENYKGVAYKSSVGKCVLTYKDSLNAEEKALFKKAGLKLQYLD